MNKALPYKLNKGFYILIQLLIERMFRKCCHITKNYKFHSGTCYCHIHSPKVVQETYLSFFICPYKTYQYNITFLSLETINGIDCYKLPIWLEPCVLTYQQPEILYLSLIRRYNTYVNTLVEETFTPYFVYILFQFAYKLIAARLINTVFNEIYSSVIAIVFNPTQLAFFNRANSFQYMTSVNIVSIVQRVAVPVMCEHQNSETELRNLTIHFIKNTMQDGIRL